MRHTFRAVNLFAAVIVAGAGAALAANTASFYAIDTTTRGHWHDGTGSNRVYGRDGYWLITTSGGPWKSLPAYATVVDPLPTPTQTYAGGDKAEDARYLLKPGSSTHEDGIWYTDNAGRTFTGEVTIAVGKTCLFSIYAWDWDGNNHGLKFEILDGDSGATNDTQTVSDYGAGKYFVWAITGHVKVRIIGVASRPFVSGMFFDPLPPPVITSTPATNVLNSSACLNASLTSTGGAPTYVWAYWDTTDRTTNKTWANTNYFDMQPVTGLTYQATGLSPNTTYWFTYYASNANGEAWAQPSRSFKTQGAAPGADNGGGAVVLGPFAARLKGTLTAGGSAAGSFIWGPVSGNLTNTMAFVTCAEGLVFTTNVTGLARNSTYYYSAFVSNGYGTAQAPETNFTTTDYLLIDASTNLVPSQSALYSNESVVVRDPGVVLTLLPNTNYGTLQTYFFGNLTVSNGAAVQCLGQTNGPIYDASGKGVAVAASASVTVAAGSSINADGQGFAASKGPGKGIGAPMGYDAAGASHGGVGGGNGFWDPGANGCLYPAPRAATYGVLTAPTALGSGGLDSGGKNNRGGGAVKISAPVVTAIGMISANAPDNTFDNFCSPGAGGSVWIVADTFLGNGLVAANGGSQATTHYRTGGGGGGRIAVVVSTNLFTGAIRAYGGAPAFNYQTDERGGAGTIFVKLPSQPNGELVIENTNATPCAVTHLAGTNDTATYAFDRLTIRTNAALEVIPGQTLDMSDASRPISSDGTAVLINNGTCSLPTTFAVTNFALANHNGASLGNLSSLTIGPPSGTLTHLRNLTADVYRLELTVNTLTIQSGGKVTADACGYGARMGPGAPLPADGTYRGAGHAGRGESSTNYLVYGNAFTPTNSGSGGMYWYDRHDGGGIIKIKVKGILTVNGTVSAKGYSPPYGGAGAGGSVWLDAGRLAGTGTINADGGVRSTASGGGGRVSITYRTSSFTGIPLPGLYTNQETMSATVSAKGGYNTGANGVEDGSVYIEKVPTGSLFMLQ